MRFLENKLTQNQSHSIDNVLIHTDMLLAFQSPGGVLGLADMVPLKNEKFNNIWQKRGRRYLCFPDENMYCKDKYREKLEKAGFTNIDIESIAGPVYGGSRKYFMKRIFNKSLNPKSFEIKSLSQKDLVKGPKLWGFDFGTSDYILVSAVKPKN